MPCIMEYLQRWGTGSLCQFENGQPEQVFHVSMWNTRDFRCDCMLVPVWTMPWGPSMGKSGSEDRGFSFVFLSLEAVQ